MSLSTDIKLLISELGLLKYHVVSFFKGIVLSFKLTVFKTKIFEYEGLKIDSENKFFILPIRKFFVYKFYESTELSILKKTLSSDDKVLELGTGIGVLAMAIAKIIGEKNIVTYEASPELIPIIKKNFKLNNLDIRLENKVLVLDSELIRYRRFYNNDNFFLGSTMENSGNSNFYEVPTENFFHVLEQEQTTYLLMDIEGEEVTLLTPPLPSKIKKICMEVHPVYQNTGDALISDMLLNLMQQGFHLELTKSVSAHLYLSRN